MALKKASELKAGDRIKLTGQTCRVESTEISDIGKQGKRKVRLVIKTERLESLIIVRPEDYTFELA